MKESMFLVRAGHIINDKHLKQIVSQQISKHHSTNIENDSYDSLKEKYGHVALCKSMREFYRGQDFQDFLNMMNDATMMGENPDKYILSPTKSP